MGSVEGTCSSILCSRVKIVVLETLWQEFLKIVCVEVGSRVVETWFKAVSLVRWDAHNKVVYLKAPNVFIKEWMETHYRALFNQHLGRLLNETSLKITFVSEESQPSPVQNAPVENNVTVSKPTSVAQRGPLMQHRFETFVVGPHNSLAYAAAHAVIENPGLLYNPLLIWGASGFGKTHLLQAIGNQFKFLDKKITVLYQTADRFVNEFVAAVRCDRIPQFEARYKGADVLLMDDIQYISRKEQTQEIFFHIFNSLHQARKQVVFTCDALPSNINGFSERIRSRLEGGLVADLQPASLESRTAILHKKAASHEVILNEEIAAFIAGRIRFNIRDLESSLIRVLAFASFTRQPVTLELVEKVLGHLQPVQHTAIDFAAIVKEVGRFFNYTVHEIKSSKRSRDLSSARQISMYLMKKLTDRSLREIAFFLARKDHSTVIHGITRIEELKSHDPAFASVINKIEQQLKM